MKLARVKEWTEGKAPFAAYMSAFLVVRADDMIAALKGQTHHTKYAMLFHVDDLATWARLYRSFFDETTLMETLQAFSRISSVEALPSLTEELTTIKALDDLNRPAITTWLRKHLLDDFNHSEDESGEEERLRGLKPLSEIPVIAFTFKVFLPCMIYHQSSPAMLLKRASHGDLEALRSLLQIDKHVLLIPEVFRVWEPISRIPQSANYRMLMRAMNSQPHKSLEPMRVKASLALAIESLFRHMGQPVTRPQIRDLFDRYAQDTKESMVDEDLPGTPDAFDKAIRREINAWKATIESHAQHLARS